MDYERLKKKKVKAQREGDLRQLILCCKELGGIYFDKEDYDKAIEEFGEMEKAAAALNSEIDVAVANRMFGEAYLLNDDCEQAIFYSQKFLSIAKKLNDRLEEQRAVFTLGRVYYTLAEQIADERHPRRIDAIHKSKQYYLDSLAVADQLSDKLVGSKEKCSMKARSFMNIALTCEVEGQMLSAIEYLQQAVCICKKNDLWEDLFRIYNALGVTHYKNGNSKEAISFFDKNIPVAERLSSKVESLCEVLFHKAEALLDLPDFRGARQCLLKAYKLKPPRVTLQNAIEAKLRIVAAMCEIEIKLTELPPEGHDDERKKLYEALGDMASDQKAYSVALTYYTLMLQCVERSGGDDKALKECYVSLAATYQDNKQLKKALEYYKKVVALEKGLHEEACRTYLNIAELYHLIGKNSNAMEAYKTAKLCAEAVNNPKLLKLVLTNMRVHLEEVGNHQEANRIAEEIDSTCSESGDEEEDNDQKDNVEYGAHINLDELSDPEADDDIASNKVTRTRARPKASLDKKKNDLGETPLHRAAIAGNLTLATKLIDQGHRVDVRDNSGWTPLHEAANLGHLEVVELLLKKGAPVNDRGGSACDGFTPLLDAARNGHFDIMELLLQYKASPLMKNNAGLTVLDLMEEWKHAAEEESIDGSLDRETLTRYKAMYSKLQQILERAGHKPSHKTMTPLKDNSDLVRSNARALVREEDDFLVNVEMPALRDDFGSSPTRISQRSGLRAGAASEYESAMRALRFRTNTDQCHSSLIMEPKQPALVSAEEFVGDDWLEEDVVRPTKKRRTSEFLSEPQRRRKSDEAIVDTLPPTLPSARKPDALFPDSSNDSLDWNSVVEATPSTRMSPDPLSPSTSGTSSNMLKMKNISRKQGLSLSASGVSKEKNGKITYEDVLHFIPPPSVTSSVICVRILVEGKLLLVPIPSRNDHLTIDWLAEETAKRYKSLEEVEPKLRLLTADGAILLNSDPVSLVVGMGELQGQVLSWNLPSLVSSYEEICFNNNIIQDSSVVAILEECPASGSADLSDTFLEPRHLMCVLKVLSHHHQLQALNLSGNNVSDSCMKELTEYLVKLGHLRSLNLSNICISCEGLVTFSQIIVDRNGLQRLQNLDIGYNPLGDCLKPLGNLVSHLPALTRLLMPSVELVTQSFRSHLDFTLDSLETIDLSYNDIGTEGVIDLLGRLNPRRIQQLHLSYTGGKTIREVGLYLQTNAPPSLRLLDVSYCPASEEDMREFIQGLEMCPHLEKLVLEGVFGLDQRNLDYLMGCKNICSLNLAGSIEVTQPLQVVEHMATLAITSSSNQNLQKLPYNLFVSGPLHKSAVEN